MPITRQTIAHTAYMFSAFSGFSAIKNGSHTAYNATAVRTNYTTTATNSGYELVTFSKDPGGTTIYLTYLTNEITSVRLPNPPPVGVTTFTTDNLSGCKVFVDTINGSNDIIVYHANARMHSPIGNQGAVRPATETGAATLHLDTLHTNARLHYTTQGLVLADGSDIDKPFYNENANAAVQRAIGLGHKRIEKPKKKTQTGYLDAPEFVGGTVVFGFFVPAGGVAAHWELHYQTWGAVEYREPGKLFKKKVKHKADNFAVLQYGQFFPEV